jgi:hypothetical protein
MAADIVLAIGTSHSPLLNSPAEDYPKHATIDDTAAISSWRVISARRKMIATTK